MLLIEDSNIARKNIRDGLRNYNIAFVEATDGNTGINMAESERPDIILLDLNLPDLTGFSILQNIRNNPATAKIPAIITTSSHHPEDVEKAMAAGAQYYLIKPVHIGKLLTKITHLLNITEEEISSLSFNKILPEEIPAETREGKKTVSYQKIDSKLLKPDMIIGLPVMIQNGETLFKSFTVLDEEKIKEIIEKGINFVYIT